MSKIKRWLLSAGVAIPGAVLYRAVDSQWFEAGEYTFLLTFIGLTLALGGVVLFIFLLNFARDDSK